MIQKLYRQQKKMSYVSYTISVLAIVITLWVVLKPELYATLSLGYPGTQPWQYITGVFVHGTKDGGAGLALLHLLANLLLFLPYAVPVEKALGQKRFVLALALSLFVNDIVFLTLARHLVQTPEDTATGAGLSGIAFTFITLGTYLILQTVAQNPKKAFREPLTYLFLSGLIAQLFILLPQVAGIASFIVHLAGLTTGLLLLVPYRKALNRYAKQSL